MLARLLQDLRGNRVKGQDRNVEERTDKEHEPGLKREAEDVSELHLLFRFVGVLNAVFLDCKNGSCAEKEKYRLFSCFNTSFAIPVQKGNVNGSNERNQAHGSSKPHRERDTDFSEEWGNQEVHGGTDAREGDDETKSESHSLPIEPAS